MMKQTGIDRAKPGLNLSSSVPIFTATLAVRMAVVAFVCRSPLNRARDHGAFRCDAGRIAHVPIS